MQRLISEGILLHLPCQLAGHLREHESLRKFVRLRTA